MNGWLCSIGLAARTAIVTLVRIRRLANRSPEDDHLLSLWVRSPVKASALSGWVLRRELTPTRPLL